MELFVARQPIFDRRQQVYGYELLFRSNLENAFHADNQDQASFEMLRASSGEIDGCVDMAVLLRATEFASSMSGISGVSGTTRSSLNRP